MKTNSNPQTMRYATSLLLAVLTAGCQLLPFESNRRAEHAALGDDFELFGGESVTIDETGLRVTFEAIENDSRCPIDGVCVWQGRAVIVLQLQEEGASRDDLQLTIPGLVAVPYEQNEAVAYGDYTVKLLSLSPYPDTRKRTPRLSQYRALLRVER